MPKETSDIEKLYKCVRSFLELGDRRGRPSRHRLRPTESVLVGDSEDARTSNFSFMGYVYQNWPSKRQVTLKNDNRTQTVSWASTQTVDGKYAYSFLWNGKPAYMFPWNELTEDLWHRQFERTRLWEGIRTAEPQDLEAMAELIVEQTKSGYQAIVYLVPQYSGGVKTGTTVMRSHWPDWSRMERELMKLSVPDLRKLNSLISVGRSEAKIAVDRADDGSVVSNETHQAA